MPIRLLIGMLLLTGCATPALSVINLSACTRGEECAVDGVIEADYPWEATLRVSDGCIALALPEAYHAPGRSLADTSVRVSGFAMAQPEMSGGETFYEVEGRRVNKNVCEYAIIVREIEDARGKVLWRQ